MNSFGRHASAYLAAFLVFCAVAAQGINAPPTVHKMTQPDGAAFEARQWGDEWSHGWETKDGYSIVQAPDDGVWHFAVQGADGRLVSTGIRADTPPPAWLSKKVRAAPVSQPQDAPAAAGSSDQKSASPASPMNVGVLGSFNVAVLMISFPDRTTSFTASQFQSLLFGSGVATGPGNLKDYYAEVSYGRLNLSLGPSGIGGWYTASNNHDYYGANDPITGKDLHAAELVKEAVLAAYAAGFDFSTYDQDGDGYVDSLIVIHQGEGEEAGGSGGGTASDIWSKRSSLAGSVGEVTVGNVKVNGFTLQPEKQWGKMVTIGVFAHEFGHVLGLPDLYDTDYSSEGVGNWSLMAGGNWAYTNRAGDSPAHMDAWSKYFLGWAAPTQIWGSTSLTIPVVETNPTIYQLLPGNAFTSAGASTPKGEYFLVENRQKTGFDVALPGSGLLIWHIDEAMRSYGDTKEWYPGCTTACPDPTKHYRVALVQADNLYELERNTSSGNAGDPFASRSFNSTSTPNSSLWSGAANGVAVDSITASAASMTATFTAPATACTDSYEPNETRTTAYGPITAGQLYSGKICYAEDADWFKLVTAAPGTLSLNLTVPPAPADFDLELYNAAGSRVAYSWRNPGYNESITYQALTPGTYYVLVPPYSGFDSSNPYTLSYTFSTTMAPTVASAGASPVTLTGATLNGNVNPNGLATSAWFEWGTSSTSLGTTTVLQSVGSGSATVNISQAISGLTTGVTYYYRAAASSSAGTLRGFVLSFTAGTLVSPPAATTAAASAVGDTSATLNGTVNPNSQATNAWFEWGASSTSLSNTTAQQSVGFGSANVNVSQPITGLTPGATYYYRVAASSAAGTARGDVLSFTTSTPANQYLAGDAFPLGSDHNADGDKDDAGEFGDGLLQILDLIYALRAVTSVPGYRPPACSDRFDAMDAFPADTATTRGGDGILNTVDLIYTLRRVTSVDTNRWWRSSRNVQPCTSGAGQEVVTQGYGPPGPGQPAGRLQFGSPLALADGSTRVPVYLQAERVLALAGLSFSLQLSAVSGTTAPRGSWDPEPGVVPAPTLVDADVPGMLAVAWLDGLRLEAGRRVLLGYVVGAGSLRFQGISATTPDGGDVPLSVLTQDSSPVRE